MNKTEFGKYTLLERISHGGMAEVFRARTMGAAGFERTVALKVLLPQIASEEEVIAMLIDEAKIAGQLSHANIAQTFDLGEVEGRYYIVQEFVDGLDLRRLVAKLMRHGGALDIAHACHIVLRVCEGLDYAHNKRDLRGVPLEIVHRDISPQNVIVSYEGEVKLVDFGIARAEGRVTRTLAGLVKGKFAYMSPEQIRGLPVDRRSDVFACGILLHELLSGQPLFRRESDYETLERTRSAVIEPPSDHDPTIPAELDRITLRALARHVDDRYQSAVAMRDELWAFVQQHQCHCSRAELGAWMRKTFVEPTATPAVKLDDGVELSQITETGLPGDGDTETGGTVVDGDVAVRIMGRLSHGGAGRHGDNDTTTAAEPSPDHTTAAGPPSDTMTGPGPDTAVGARPAHRAPLFVDETTSERPSVRRTEPERAVVTGSQRRLALAAQPTPPPTRLPLARARPPSLAAPPGRDPDRSSPYLAFMNAGERAADAMVPQEAPDREDLVPTSLQLLRSSGAMPRRSDAPAAAAGRPNLTFAVVLALLVGVAVVCGFMLWRDGSPGGEIPTSTSP